MLLPAIKRFSSLPPGARTGTLSVLILACAALTIASTLHAANSPLQKSFAVSEVVSDASPFWYCYILQVAAEGPDSLVTYIRMAPMDAICPDAVTVKAATIRLPGVQPVDLVPGYGVCQTNVPALKRALKREVRKQGKRVAIDDSLRFGIVATCGDRQTVIHLPFPEQVNLDRLRKTSPKLARWWDLPAVVKNKAFGARNVFADSSAEQEEQLLREGEIAVAALRSGRFDPGLQYRCSPGLNGCGTPSFRDDLSGYVGSVGFHGTNARLTQANEYRFKRYVDVKYPILAMMARISGSVRVDVSLDASTGRVQEVNFISGHPLFKEAVTSAVRQWQFEADGFGGDAKNVPVELVFEFNCPVPVGDARGQ